MRTRLLTLLSLFLACLSNPGMPAPWLAWMALVPLFIAADASTPVQRTILFGTWGVGWWCWSVWWLVPAAISFINLAPWLAVLTWFAICLVLSAPYWLIGALWNAVRFDNPWLTCVTRALLFSVSISLLASWIPASIASGQHNYVPLIQIVDLGGTAILLFVLALVNLLLTNGVRFTRSQRFYLATALTVIASLAFYGQYRITAISSSSATTFTVGYVQPNLQRDDTIDPLLQMTRDLAQSEPDIDLLAWPEFPPAFSWSDNDQDHARVNALLRDIDKPLLLNSGYVFAPNITTGEQRSGNWNNGGPKPYYNAAQLIGADGRLLGSYYKQQLVPFFEFLPFDNMFLTLRQHFPNSLSYVPGNSDQPLAFNDDIHIAPLICYEMIFPQIASRQVANGANVFINLSNDGWFGTSRGSISHLALAQFRATEHHRPWIRVTNSGISAVANAYGELLPLATIELAERDARAITVSIPQMQSFYSQYPNAFMTVATVLLLIALGYKTVTVRRPSHVGL
jgi:apolipoprotein N-acyltransferase